MRSTSCFLKHLTTVFVCLVLTFSFVCCKAGPAPDAGFLEDPKELREDDNMPFNRVWFKEGLDFSNYNNVIVTSVDVSHMLAQDWWDEASIASETKEFDPKSEAKYLADYFKKRMEQSITKSKDKEFRLTTEPVPGTLLIELALVEVVPTKAWLNTISYVLLGPVDSGSTAMEGRIRDAETGEIVFKFKDREYGQFDVVSIADLEWYSHSKHTIDNWADKIVQIMEAGPAGDVSGSAIFTLRPW